MSPAKQSMPYREAPVHHAIVDEHVHDPEESDAQPSAKAHATH